MLTKSFVLGGRAVFTVEVPADAQARSESKPHYTYRVASFQATNGTTLYSVSLLAGPDNESDYQYLGMLDVSTGNVRTTAKSRFADTTAPVKLVRWALAHLWKDAALPNGFKAHHEGRCARCGRTLTTPESVERGFGPECFGKVA